MRVGIDVTPLLRPKTGIGVCTSMLVDGLVESGHEVVGLVGGWRRMKEGFPQRDPSQHKPAQQNPRMVANWLPRFLNPLFLDLLAWPTAETLMGEIDLFVATNYLMLPTRRAKRVAILHDVGRLRHPELYSARQVVRARFTAQRCARLADLIVVPTRATAEEVQELGLAPASRIRVVPLGARPLPVGECVSIGNIPVESPLLLCVTNMERRKNLPLLVRAFQRASSRLPHHLVVVGGGGSDAQLVGSIARGNGAADRIHFVGAADEHQLGALYRRAELTLCPSLYEGFGLTLLEAMSCGCPVVASDIPPHREVGGNAVRLVPPRDEASFAEAIVELAGNPALRATMREEGIARSSSFSWEATRRSLVGLVALDAVLATARCGR